MKMREWNLQIFGGGGGGGASSQQCRKRDPEPEELTKMRQGLYDKIFPNIDSFEHGGPMHKTWLMKYSENKTPPSRKC